MGCFCISYDLYRKSSKNYSNILSHIKSSYECISHQKSVLIVVSKLGAEDIRMRLLPYIDANDRLDVFEINRTDVDKLRQ